jgi:hypothetical protein
MILILRGVRFIPSDEGLEPAWRQSCGSPGAAVYPPDIQISITLQLCRSSGGFPPGFSRIPARSRVTAHSRHFPPFRQLRRQPESQAKSVEAGLA